MLCESRGVGLARFYVAKNCAHRISFPQLHADPVDLAFAWRGHTHDSFVCLDIDDFLIIDHFVAGFDLDVHNRSFGDGFAQLRHDDRDLRHKLFSKQLSRFCCNVLCVWAMRAPEVWMIRNRSVFCIQALRGRIQQMKPLACNSRDDFRRRAAPRK